MNINTGQTISIRTGTYNGDDSIDRAIAHGLGTIPKIVIITKTTGAIPTVGFILSNNPAILMNATNAAQAAVTAMTSTNFNVGAGVNEHGFNKALTVMYWLAIG